MKPFLKWAGNKHQIIEQILSVLPTGQRLIEPFVGSGAVFLNTQYPRYLLADGNPDLIAVYTTLKKQGETFINTAKQYFTPKYNCPTAFYEMRELFNTTTDPLLKACLFIYLNKHSFNGLCRYNASGQFNAPFGHYEKPYFPAKEMRHFYQKTKRVVFKHADFLHTLKKAKPGDVIYCDPPYVPLSTTANFTHYSAGGFDNTQQQRLATQAQRLAKRGIPVLISNHATPFTLNIYKEAQIIRFNVQRYISCKGTQRVKVPELLAVFS